MTPAARAAVDYARSALRQRARQRAMDAMKSDRHLRLGPVNDYVSECAVYNLVRRIDTKIETAIAILHMHISDELDAKLQANLMMYESIARLYDGSELPDVKATQEDLDRLLREIAEAEKAELKRFGLDDKDKLDAEWLECCSWLDEVVASQGGKNV